MIKKLFHPAAILAIGLLLVLLTAGATHTGKISGLENSTGAVFFLQVTPTPRAQQDLSEIGSTDGIVIMGGVILLIVLIPILAKRKSWMQAD